MLSVVVLGAGKIGSMIVQLLASCEDYRIIVADGSAQQLDRLDTSKWVTRVKVDFADREGLQSLFRGHFAVLSAAPFHATLIAAESAKAVRTHYLDLTEDVATTRAIKHLADRATTAFIPQCGLAPGFISIVTADLIACFDQVHDVKMRVGALPTYPSNALNYNLTWSTEGVINEYCEPCEAIQNGQLREAKPLEECEEFSMDGVLYEAFNTAGGLGTMCETLSGKVRSLKYQTIRYPGHAKLMKVLLEDLRLRDRRELLKDILEHSLPTTRQDVVIVFVTVIGLQGGHLLQETYIQKLYSRTVGGRLCSAIEITTAASICAVLDLLAAGNLQQEGLVRQENISLQTFLSNRFGAYYRRPMAALDVGGKCGLPQ